jgi:hypothetical protein
MPCRIDLKFFKLTLSNPYENAEELIHQSKFKFAMQKDELVMTTTKKMNGPSGQAAYPLVVTTIGDLNETTKTFLKEIYKCYSVTDFVNATKKEHREEFIKDKPDADTKQLQTIGNNMPEFRCQGVALGQAFASPLSGDTVATVLVGGMATVMNGAFEIFAGPSACPRPPRARPAPAPRPPRARARH